MCCANISSMCLGVCILVWVIITSMVLWANTKLYIVHCTLYIHVKHPVARVLLHLKKDSFLDEE